MIARPSASKRAQPAAGPWRSDRTSDALAEMIANEEHFQRTGERRSWGPPTEAELRS